MATKDKPPGSGTSGKARIKRRARAGKTTGRTAGLSQSAFAGYAVQQPPQGNPLQDDDSAESSAEDRGKAEDVAPSPNNAEGKGEKE